MEYPKPKFKKGDRVEVDGFDTGKIAASGIFKKKSTGKIYVAYKITENILPEFWAEEDRIKLLTP